MPCPWCGRDYLDNDWLDFDIQYDADEKHVVVEIKCGFCGQSEYYIYGKDIDFDGCSSELPLLFDEIHSMGDFSEIVDEIDGSLCDVVEFEANDFTYGVSYWIEAWRSDEDFLPDVSAQLVSCEDDVLLNAAKKVVELEIFDYLDAYIDLLERQGRSPERLLDFLKEECGTQGKANLFSALEAHVRSVSTQ